MKKYNRAVSTVILACFILNTALSDFAFGQSVNLPAYKLAAQSKFSNIQSIENKDIGDIELWFTAAVNYLDTKGVEITRESLQKFADMPDSRPGKTIFQLKETQFFIHEIPPAEDGVIRIKVRRSDFMHGPRTYFIEYSSGYHYLDVYREGRASQRTLQEVKETERYKRQEEGQDRVIRYAFENGLVAEPLKERFDYIGWVTDTFRRLNIKVANPNGLIPVENRQFKLIKVTPELKKLMISLPKSVIVDTNGKEHEVAYIAHSSNNAVYFFATENDFDLFTSPGRKISPADMNLARDTMGVWLVHEMGVMLGRVPHRFIRHGIGDGYEDPVNDVDERYFKMIKNPKTKFPELQLDIVNLDTNLATRDYAAGKRIRRNLTGKTTTGKPISEIIIAHALYELLRTTLRWDIVRRDADGSHSYDPRDIEGYLSPQETADKKPQRIYGEVCYLLENKEGQPLPDGSGYYHYTEDSVPLGQPNAMLLDVYRAVQNSPDMRKLFKGRSEGAAFKVLDAMMNEIASRYGRDELYFRGAALLSQEQAPPANNALTERLNNMVIGRQLALRQADVVHGDDYAREDNYWNGDVPYSELVKSALGGNIKALVDAAISGQESDVRKAIRDNNAGLMDTFDDELVKAPPAAEAPAATDITMKLIHEIEPLINPSKPVTVAEMVDILRERKTVQAEGEKELIFTGVSERPVDKTVLEAIRRILESEGMLKDESRPAAEAPEGDDGIGEAPVAATGQRVPLSALASHKLVNALIAMTLHNAFADDGILKDGFVTFEKGKNGGYIYWFGYRDWRNKTFLDIFNRFAELNANRNGRSKISINDEIKVAKDLVNSVGYIINGVVPKIDEKFVGALKEQLSLQVEHFGVERGDIYAMLSYRNKKETIENHVGIERGLHLAVIAQTFGGDWEKYYSWRRPDPALNKQRPVDIIISLKDPNIELKSKMTYNAFADTAHEIAETNCPLSRSTIYVAPEQNIHFSGVKSEDVPTAGVRQPDDKAQPAEARIRSLQQRMDKLTSKRDEALAVREEMGQLTEDTEPEIISIAHQRDEELAELGQELESVQAELAGLQVTAQQPAADVVAKIEPVKPSEELKQDITAWLAAGEYGKLREQLFDSAVGYFKEASYRDYELKPPKTKDFDAELTVISDILLNTADGRKFLSSDSYESISGITRVRLAIIFGLPIGSTEITDEAEKVDIITKLYANPLLQDAEYRSIRSQTGRDIKPVEYTVMKINGFEDYLIIDNIHRFVSYISAPLSAGSGSKLLWYFHIYKSLPESVAQDSTTVSELRQRLIEFEDAGKQILTDAENRFTLLIDNNVYMGGECEKDIKGYDLPDGRHIGTADRFDLEKVNTSDINNILEHIKDPARTVVQVARELTSDELKLLNEKAPGLRIVRVDTAYFKNEELDSAQRRDCRFSLYSMMLLARQVAQEDKIKKTSTYQALAFMLDTHFGNGEEAIADKYIEAILKGDLEGLSFIIKHNLSYRPVGRWNVPEYHTITAALISA